MGHVDGLLARIAETAAELAPLSALSSLSASAAAPVHPMQYLLEHLTTTTVHDTYFPFIRFGAMHAARVAASWAAMTKTRGGNVSVLQDLLGYLTVAWGGGTLASLLMSTPPAWLVSPTPWLVYTAVYAALVPTGMASFIVKTCPALPFNLAMSAVDGMTRGMTITAMSVLVSSSGSSVAGGWWTAALLGAIATNGGGWIAQAVGMHKTQWTPGRPAVLDGGILGTLDVWGAIVVGVIYAALTRASPTLEPLGDVLSAAVPAHLRDASFTAKATEMVTGQAVVSKDTARAIAVLVLGSLFALRAFIVQITQWTAPVAGRDKKMSEKRRAAVPVAVAASETVVKSPTEASESPKPKKRRARKSKSPTPP